MNLSWSKSDRSNEAVATLQSVIEESEGSALPQRDEPDRHLRHLHGERVDVDAVDAPFGDDSPCDDQSFLAIHRQQSLVRTTFRRATPNGDRPKSFFGRCPRFDDALAQVATNRDEEGTRPHRGVADLEVEKLLDGPEAPLFRRPYPSAGPS